MARSGRSSAGTSRNPSFRLRASSRRCCETGTCVGSRARTPSTALRCTRGTERRRTVRASPASAFARSIERHSAPASSHLRIFCKTPKYPYNARTMVVRMRANRSKTGKRRSHQGLSSPRAVRCECGALRLPHRACLECGRYRGRVVIDVVARAKRDARRSARKEKELRESGQVKSTGKEQEKTEATA